jgi:hypothetical protein
VTHAHDSPSVILHQLLDTVPASIVIQKLTYAGRRGRGKGRSRRGEGKGGGSDELHFECLLEKRNFVMRSMRWEFVIDDKASVSSLMVASPLRTITKKAVVVTLETSSSIDRLVSSCASLVEHQREKGTRKKI